MDINGIKNIAVVGAGNMGHQIALLCAMHGYQTKCTDVKPEILAKAQAFADSYLPGRVKKGKLTQEQADAARALVSFTPDLAEAVADADFVIEAVVEMIDAKRKLFARKEELESQIDLLKFQKAAMSAAEYKKQLSALLLELAKTQEDLEK